jgi:hypothetical protein
MDTDYDPEYSDIYSLGCFLFGMVTKEKVSDFSIGKMQTGEIREDLNI